MLRLVRTLDVVAIRGIITYSGYDGVLPGPVLELAALTRELKMAREKQKRIVLTNGVFDLLHIGHLRYLRQARVYGDLLVVGVNADRAVTKPGRPLVPGQERAELVAALEPVDFVTIFEELTADHLLLAIRPDVYVKGDDYSEATLAEAGTAREVHAELMFVPTTAGHSTSQLIERLRE